MTTYRARVTYLDHNPASITFNSFPNMLPVITYDDNTSGGVRAQFATVYDSGIATKPVKMCKLDTFSVST
eukprot:UN03328